MKTTPTVRLGTLMISAAFLIGPCLQCVAADSKTAPPAGKSKGLPEGVNDLKIGDMAPSFSLPGIDGKVHSLSDYGAAKVLMVAFISNHCPDSHAAEGRIKKLLSEMKEKSFSLIAINPNNPDGLSIDELGYSKYNDGFEDMKRYAADAGFNFPYLYDGETQATSKAFGCLATPHIFIFDAERKLRYKGQFDDSRYADDHTVASHDARNAVDALFEGKEISVPVTKPHGCSTKWLGKKELVAEKMEKWDRTPVDVELLSAEAAASLRKNGTNKVRLFNVWATWCGPCVSEFPTLVNASRKFGLRDFEMITVSADAPEEIGKVKGFLEKRGAGMSAKLQASVRSEGRTTNSYLFSGSNINDLMAALDPEWPGGMPHTVLVGTDGKVVWRHNGPVDGSELIEQILTHMGPFYKP